MKKMMKAGVVALSLVGIASLANAATEGAYVGAGLGWSNMGTSQLTKALKTVPGLTVSTSKNNLSLGGRLFAGYNFNQYLGVEAGLAHYATTTYKLTTSAGATTKPEYEGNAFDVVGKAYLPLSNTGFNLYALGGAAYVKQTVDTNAASGNRSISHTGIRPKFGVGASYDINPHLTASFEVSRIQGKGNLATSDKALANSDMATLNLAYNFG